MTFKSGFTHRLNGEPIPPRQPPYVGQFSAPCKTGEREKKALAAAPTNTFSGAVEAWAKEVVA